MFFPFLPLLLTAFHSNEIWTHNNAQTLDPQQTLDDTGTEFTGVGSATITDDGRLVLAGDAPRYRILEPKFDNVSITLDARRVSEEEELSYQGFVIGARSQHYDNSVCGANTYYASVTYDGRARFEKELFHGEGANAYYPAEGDQPQIFEDGIPKNVWIKLNFTIVTDEDNNARLSLSVDNKQVLEYTDSGDWPVDAPPDIDDECDGYYPDNKIIQAPGFTFIRNDGLGRAEYRNLNIVEK